MKVLKFGGTSVGSARNMLNLKEIVEAQNEPVIVVVSALGGVTDKLLSIVKMASEGDKTCLQEITAIEQRHYDLIKEVVAPAFQSSIKSEIANLVAGLTKEIQAIENVKNPPTETIVSFGERMSAPIVAGCIDGAVFRNALDFVKTNEQFGKHAVDFTATNNLIIKEFAGNDKIAVCSGFISTDKLTGKITNLGRGGSDYTAAIIAAALQASQLEIWTDVDGFMTADPRVISNAYVIDKLSYVEAMELCNFGAKVIYPPTIFPVYHKNIPIVIKNTANPQAQGTLISREYETDKNRIIKGISSINDTALVTMQGMGMVGVIGVSRRLFGALAEVGINVFLISQAASENTITVGVKNAEADLAVEVLNKEFAEELRLGEINRIKSEKNLATVAIVGDNMKHISGISGKLFGTLGRNGINVMAIAQGASETNISFVVDAKSLNKTLNVVHEAFFLSDYQVLNVFLTGIGTVGGDLLKQIRQQQDKLLKQNRFKLNVVGIADIDNAIFDAEGIDLSAYKEQLRAKGQATTPELLKKEVLEMNIFNSVFVDCTGSFEIAALYEDFLSNNISVVAANKIAASSDYENYAKLKHTARKKGVKFLFETNVGAGLPIMNTINNLINSGDKILKIEAVLSGTLNYIFNTLSEEIPLSKTIVMAKEAGYAEPDPRIDLSGKDVIRKLVILAREAGYKLEQDDVAKNLFVPNKYFEGSLSDFWDTIGELDAQFETDRQRLEKEGKKYRFVAKMEKSACSVGLQEVDSHHPFFDLEGSNNIIMLTTERYHEYPMIIKGYGAGAGVTAAGVFADIMSVANIR